MKIKTDGSPDGLGGIGLLPRTAGVSTGPRWVQIGSARSSPAVFVCRVACCVMVPGRSSQARSVIETFLYVCAGCCCCCVASRQPKPFGLPGRTIPSSLHHFALVVVVCARCARLFAGDTGKSSPEWCGYVLEIKKNCLDHLPTSDNGLVPFFLRKGRLNMFACLLREGAYLGGGTVCCGLGGIMFILCE